MPDTAQPATDDPFGDIDPQMSGIGLPKLKGDDPFADLNLPPVAPGQSSGIGAFTSGAVRGAAPALGGMVAASAGAGAGGAIGALGGPIGAGIGALVGGVGGFFAGSGAVQGVQDWAVHQMPDSWQEAIGQSDRQRRVQEMQHPTASFLGGMLPYAVTMMPGSLATKALNLPADATAFQRLMANPVTSRVFGGAAMGGGELGQEELSGQQPNWTRVGISTAFGLVFNKPTRFGEYLSGLGANVARAPFAVPREGILDPAEPTVAQGADVGVLGPGITESTFQGGTDQSLASKTTAQNTASDEQSLLGAQPEPDLHAIARRAEPELFGQRDELEARETALRQWIADESNPPDSALQDIADKRAQLQIALDYANPNGPDARNLRVQLADLDTQESDLNERRAAWAEGRHEETPALAMARQHLLDTQQALWAMGPDISAAMRRAADHVGQVEEAPPAVPEPAVASVESPPPQAIPATPSTPAFDMVADRTAQLVAAGMPREQAEASAAVEAHYYRTRAARFGGARGTAEDLYNARSAEVRGQAIGGKPAEVAAPTESAPIEAVPAEAPLGPRPRLRSIADIIAEDKIAPNKAKGVQEQEMLALVDWQTRQREASQPTAPVSAPPLLIPTVESPAIAQHTDTGHSTGIESLDPADIGIDAKTYQFKSGGDESGVTDRLEGTEQWDSKLADIVLVHRDADGKLWIADGYQRLGLAKRLMAAGHAPIRLNAFVLDARDPAEHWTPESVRAYAAAKNIGQGTGTAIDAAKVIQAADKLGITLPPMPPRSALVRLGRSIARLSPDAFGMAVNEVVPVEHAAIVGRLVTDPLQQVEAVRVLGKLSPSTAREAELIVRDMLSQGTEQLTHQGGLFGDEHLAQSAMLERAKVADEAMRQLTRDRTTFSTLVGEAERIEGHGANVLDIAANRNRLSADEQAKQLLTQLATRKGPVSDALTGIAKRVKAGEISAAEGSREFLGIVRRELETGVERGGADSSAIVGAEGERELAQDEDQGRELFQRGTKPEQSPLLTDKAGLERQGQAVIPGAEASDQQALQQRSQAMRSVEAIVRPDIKEASLRVIDAVERHAFVLTRVDRSGLSDSTYLKFQRADGRPIDSGKAGRRRYVSETKGSFPSILSGSFNVRISDHQSVGGPTEEHAGVRVDRNINAAISAVEDRARVLSDVQKEPMRPLPAQKDTGDLPLFDTGAQKQGSLFQGAQGKIRLNPGERPIITLMRDADASTFIHESAHHWLEEMMGDAQHPLAPDALKSDAQTVRKWLGIKGDKIPTKAHERYARAFEQYMREGVAPSPGLASVFAKFKAWLTTIYQTLKGLGTPISEEIRGVFDRQLALEPQRTVYADDRSHQPSLSDIHEADAKETEPQQAESVGDRVVAERDRQIAENNPEIANEVKSEGTTPGAAESGAEAGASAVGSTEVAGGGGESGTGTAGRPGSPGSGEVEPSGGATVSKSSDVSSAADTGRSASADTGPGQLAPRPAERVGDAEPKLVDLAGNIRVENLTDISEIADAIHASAERNADFAGVRGGMTKGQMLDLADAMGLDPAKINEATLANLLGGTGNLGAKILAARKLVVQSAGLVADAIKTANETGMDHDIAALGLAIARHDMIQSVLAGVTAEWGRAGNAFHSLLEGWEKAADVNQLLKDNLGRDLFQLKMIAKLGSRMDTPGKVSKFLRDAESRTFPRMMLEYWINGLISGPPTHATYMVGNTILAAEKAGPETAAAWAIGKVRAALGREGPRVMAGEIGAQASAAFRELPAAVQASLEAYRTGAATHLPGEDVRVFTPFEGDLAPNFAASMTNAHVTWSEVKGDAFGIMRGMMDGVRAGGELISAGGVEGAPLMGWQYSPLGQIGNLQIRGVTALPLGTLARLPSRNVAAIHSGFRSINYSMEINRLAYRQAATEGLTGTELAARIGDLRQNPTDAMMEQARATSTDLTLMGQGGSFVKALSALTNVEVGGWKVLKFVDPFVHIAANIIDQSIVQRTPVGLLSSEIRADVMGKNGNIAQDTALAKMLMGTGLSVLFGGMAAQGYVSGSGPSDPNKAAMWRLAGNQAHSVRIGDIWYDVHRLGPMGMLIGVAADMYEVAHQIGKEDADVVGKTLMHAFTQNILDESFMRGPADLIKAVDESDRYGASYVRNFLSSFVPYSVGMAQMARAADPYTRQARTIMDAVRRKMPFDVGFGQSTDLLPRRNIWGDPMHNPDALIAPGITAIYAQQMSRDPVNLAMNDLGISPAPVERSIRNVKLTDQQYDDFSRIAGRMTKMRLDTIVRSPDYQTWPNATKFEVINEVVRQSREAARGLMMMKYPTIPTQAARMQIARKTGEPLH